MAEMMGMDTSKLKSFWQKPEGKVGAVVLACLLGAGAIGLLKILPFLLAGALTGLQLILVLAAIAAVLYVAMDPKARALLFYAYKMVMRKATGAIIQLDPIAILKGYLESLEKNLQNMDVQIGKLRGQMRKLTDIITKNETSIQDNLTTAALAKKKADQGVMFLSTNKAGRLQKSNKTYKDLYTKMEVIYRVLSKMFKNGNLVYADTKDQIDQKEIEWNVIQASSKAMKSAMSVINGDPDKRAIFEQAMEFMADDLSSKVGEMERFMEVSDEFMRGIDLQNGVFEEKGLKMLEEWEKNADSLLLGSDKSTLITLANDDSHVLNLDEKISLGGEPGRQNQYSNLFDKRKIDVS